MKKNWLQFLKNQPFWFYKFEIKKTEPNRTKSKPKKTEPNKKILSQTGKTEPNQKNWAKQKKTAKPEKNPSQTRKNRAKPKNWVKHKKTGFCSKITEPNWNRSIWTDFGSVLIFINRFGYFFLWKPNRTENDHPYLEG